VGRQPKKQVALRPSLAIALRRIAKKERRQLSDIFQDMLMFWLKRRRKGQYEDIEEEIENGESTDHVC